MALWCKFNPVEPVAENDLDQFSSIKKANCDINSLTAQHQPKAMANL